MDRKEFISKLGIGAAFVLTTPCIIGCTKDGVGGEPLDVDFTIDLTQFDTLRTPGNYIIQDDIVIANTVDNEFIAATVKCSHEGLRQVKYDKFANNWECTAHGARFAQNGDGLNANGANGLTVYKITQTGDLLRITS